MRAKIIKIFGYIVLFIGIIGGISTIEWAINGNFAFWLVMVICFCGIGSISITASKNMNDKPEKEVSIENEIERHTKKHNTFKIMFYKIKDASSLIYHSMIGWIISIENFYIKFILTIIAITLVVIVIEFNEMNGNFSEIVYILRQIYRII